MIDINEIEREIVKLENGRTTYDTCMKLAHLYIVRRVYYKAHEVAEVETIVKEKEPVYSFGGQVGNVSVSGYAEKQYPVNEQSRNVSRGTSTTDTNTQFMKFVEAYGANKVACVMNDYLEHERVWKPVEYSRVIDYLTENC